MRIDHDLRSVQEARILVENAREAQKVLAGFSQEKLDMIVGRMAEAAGERAKELALSSLEETGFGRWQDKFIKNMFASVFLHKKIRDMKVVGIIGEDKEKKTMDIGVPVGVLVALPPATNPVSTTVYKALIAVKAGNALVVSPHPKAQKVIGMVMDILIRAGEAAGLPSGALGCLRTVAADGTTALMHHKDTAMILVTGVPKMLKKAYASGKPVIYGGPGNGPAFIERSADIEKAVSDIITGRTFDNGIVSASEQSIVAEECVAELVREELRRKGAYFMSPAESEQLSQLFFRPDGSLNPELVGQSAEDVAKHAGIRVPPETTVLLSEQDYVSHENPYSREKLCPVLAFYVERDWRHACEKCIELLVNEGRGHTLAIHSRNEEVIREFALKKPVFRVLVNTPATLGGIGVTTQLFPAMTLGCGALGGGVTSDNVTPVNLIHIRKVGYGVRRLADLVQELEQSNQRCDSKKDILSSGSKDDLGELKELLEQLLRQLA